MATKAVNGEQVVNTVEDAIGVLEYLLEIGDRPKTITVLLDSLKNIKQLSNNTEKLSDTQTKEEDKQKSMIQFH